MQPRPECGERRALREKYREALRVYIQATEALDPLEPGEDFSSSYNSAMFAWLKFEEMRQEYHGHISKHGCA